ncbi:hypothetical protein [Mitsuaria sp. 7]|uniref:hypothetical protein n=1 Tax=Mitsuaria sp. 7 TaxID=1658665 RepID=UPI0012F9B369|nr:hypothetical protein [Mitsuaria sp. 7]
MNRPTCPHCGANPVIAFFRPNFQCPACGTELSSDLRLLSVIECVVGLIPLILLAAAIKTVDAFAEWPFAGVMALLIVPAGFVHWAVLSQFLKLRATAAP